MVIFSGNGSTAQPLEDGPVPPASARAARDGPLAPRLHAQGVPRLQGQGRHEKGKNDMKMGKVTCKC